VSSAGIEVTEKGAGAAAASLLMVGERAANTAPVKPALDVVFSGDERRRFDEEGPGWARLNEATQTIKQANGLDPRILRATGALYESLTRMAGGERASWPDTIRFGTDVPYARFHQHGTRNMPKRKVVGVSTVAQAEMSRLLEAYIARGLP
jgi:phage gpG-like protein